MKIFHQFGLRSLAGRMLLSFVACVGVLWIALVIWMVYSAISGGRDQIENELESYSRQVMAVAQTMITNPEGLATAVAQVQAIEREPDSDGDSENFYIQIWHDNREISEPSAMPGNRPKVMGYHDLQVNDDTWWTYTRTNPEKKITVRLSVESGGVAAIRWPDWIAFFLPLIPSLPVLLLPAWLMTRYGLKPLRETSGQITDRVRSGALNALPETQYRELNQIIDATNQLMHRLDLQLQRERGFVAEVAHEMKTPLAIMQVNLDIIERNQDGERRDSALKDLKAGVRRSDHLIQQLLRMARLDTELDTTAQTRRADLAEFVRERVALISPITRDKNLQLELTAPNTLVTDVDLDAVSAVLDNLLDNAIKYSDTGGLIQLQLSSTNNSGFELQVQNQGPGITPADRKTAFEPFQRLANSRLGSEAKQPSGAGLGLAIVARAAERLNGQIELLTPTNQDGLLARLTVPGK